MRNRLKKLQTISLNEINHKVKPFDNTVKIFTNLLSYIYLPLCHRSTVHTDFENVSI
jgi:hypothetical protein